MSELLLDSLRIQNFRTFRDLTIDRLGRVNLIVGKNNVGKTALLEALWVWAHDEYWGDLTDELVQSGSGNGRPSSERLAERYEAVRHLFHGRPEPAKWRGTRSAIENPAAAQIVIGPAGDSEEKSLYLHVNAEVGSRIQWFRLEGARWNASKNEYERVGVLSLKGRDPLTTEPDLQPIEAVLVPTAPLGEKNLRELWSDAVKKGRKQQVLEMLRSIDEEVRDLDSIRHPLLRGNPHGNGIQVGPGLTEELRFVVSREGSPRPVPLESLGEGMRRALSIGLGLAGGAEGLTLVDEIENGLHYSVQPDVWRLIFETARDLDVQVFATTHSQDCLRAFQQVAQDYDTSESRLISLRRHEDDPENIVAVGADRDEMSVIVDHNVEVR